MNIHEEIVITNPNSKMLNMVERMREHKRMRREELRTTTPMFTLYA